MACRVVAIIQARRASSRLLGKVLLDLAGHPMLQRVVDRTSRAARVDRVLVATTTDPTDDEVAAFCAAQGILCTRGSQFDVLDRYYQAALPSRPDAVVRVTGDCPAIDPALIDDAVQTLLGASTPDACIAAFDFVANRLPPPFHRSFPIGLDVEVCTFAALERAWREGREPVHREHVMPYLYEGVLLTATNPQLETGTSPRGFRIGLRNHEPGLGSYRWTVDTPEDLAFMRQVYNRFRGRDDFSWKELLQLVQREPALSAINSSVQHKTLSDVDQRAVKR